MKKQSKNSGGKKGNKSDENSMDSVGVKSSDTNSAILLKYLPLINKLCNKYSHLNWYNDVKQECALAVLIGWPKYDKDKSAEITYIHNLITWAIFDYINAQAGENYYYWTKVKGLPPPTHVSLDDAREIAAPQIDINSDIYVEEVLNILGPQERNMFTDYYIHEIGVGKMLIKYHLANRQQLHRRMVLIKNILRDSILADR
jgi:DNA-directed RNA polymerase specialized sigma24 family protein